jgi:H+-transporting ATPase
MEQIASSELEYNLELTDMKVGLSDVAVAALRKQYGSNEIKSKQTPVLLLLAKKFWGLTPWMLEATIIISFLLHKTFDAYVILGLLIFNGAIGFINELKAAKTVAALRKELQVMARVLRNGKWLQIPGKELVPGDVVRLRMGDFLPADMELKEGEIKTDKSALTGETTLIESKPSDKVYAGSIVKAGEATAVVTAIGAQTFFGKTANLVMTASHKMHMEEVVAKVVKLLFLLVVSILTITTIIGVMNGQSLLSILPLVLILMVSAVPVGLPAMFTISMARGSKELAENGLLVSRLSATEDAATLSTLCIDKTGTITKNELTLQQTVASENFTDNDVILSGSLASVKANEDPIDLAFIEEAEQKSLSSEQYQQIKFTPFSAAIKHTEAIVALNNKQWSVAKGAYNVIKQLCGIGDCKMDATVDEWAHKGYKTIAVARADSGEEYKLVGIAALYDPPRPDAKEMIAAIKDLGIDIKMITGDALPIGKEIARQVGVGSKVISIADAKAAFEKGEAFATIQNENGFAEVLPEDKFNIVKALQQQKQIVGMTGDGVNDAPALKQAEVGIAVKNATDVAKQAASIILLKEGLEQILELIKVGRSIHVRITNYTVNKISKTIQTILFVCFSFLITGEFVVATVDMVLILFLIDFVVLALSVDKVSWSKQPASWNIKPLTQKGIIIGLLLFAECTIWYYFSKSAFQITDPNAYHSIGFACLFFSSVMSILVIRTEKRFFQDPISKTLLSVIIADIVIVCLLLYFGFSGFAKLSAITIVATVAYFAAVNFLINDTVKILISKSIQKRINPEIG